MHLTLHFTLGIWARGFAQSFLQAMFMSENITFRLFTGTAKLAFLALFDANCPSFLHPMSASIFNTAKNAYLIRNSLC